MLDTPIAIDAMGGDFAPKSVVAGINWVAKDNPDLSFILYGDEIQLKKLFVRYRRAKKVCKVVHTPDAIAMDEKPALAVRRSKNSSMRLAIQSVKVGEASAVVSAGNTGALMALSKMTLKTLPGISRPAISAFVPAMNKDVVMLDLGANVEASAQHLFEFAVMGDAFARIVLQLPHPKVALLNVGEEEMKGHEEVKEAANMLRETKLPIDFYGFVEGDDVTKGTADVVVTDGFSGNIALKTMEGTAKLIKHFLEDAIRGSLVGKACYVFARPILRKLRSRMDPRDYNGAMMLGLNGVVIKSHGGADAKSFANAILVAKKLVEQRINDRITEEMETLHELESVTENSEPETKAEVLPMNKAEKDVS